MLLDKAKIHIESTDEGLKVSITGKPHAVEAILMEAMTHSPKFKEIVDDASMMHGVRESMTIVRESFKDN